MKFLIRVFFALTFLGLSLPAGATQADDTNVVVTAQTAGATPFISKLTLTVSDLTVLNRVRFAVRPKPGSVTRPLAATYTKDYLGSRGYVDAGAGQLTVPVFGLYAAYTNTVKLTCFFGDGSVKRASATVATQPYDAGGCPFNTPTVVQARTSAKTLSYDFILVASACNPDSPTVIDTDGAVRWVEPAAVQSPCTAFFRNGIYVTAGSKLYRTELDGETKLVADYASLNVVGFHHNFDRGKVGLILDVNTVDYVASVHLEVDRAGKVLKQWNLADIISSAMIAGGDDPSEFVRTANGRYDYASVEDWTHNNAVTYRKSDDSLIISSRENFVIGLDYESGAIKWILGDTSKSWYQYASLRKFALGLAPGTIAPDGQHAVSITRNDRLLLFDNGTGSAHHTPAGPTRTYSAARKYELDLTGNIAREVWTFANNPSLYSIFRSSVYEDAARNYLVDYAGVRNADGSLRAEILGLNRAGEKVFDYSYPAPYQNVAYRAIPVHWENLIFSKPQ